MCWIRDQASSAVTAFSAPLNLRTIGSIVIFHHMQGQNVGVANPALFKLPKESHATFWIYWVLFLELKISDSRTGYDRLENVHLPD